MIILGVCQPVSLSVTWLCCANATERIDVLLGVKILEDPRNIVLDSSPYFSHRINAAFAKLLWPLVSLRPPVNFRGLI